MASGVAIEIATFGGYTFALGVHESIGFALMTSGCAQAMANVKDISKETSTWKNADVYAPDRKLPEMKDGMPIPDTNAPHTQLGTKKSKRGDYAKAREFDKDGKPVRDIDFTDHGRHHDHACPHQHRKTENSTGGTLKREDAEPVPEWRYK